MMLDTPRRKVPSEKQLRIKLSPKLHLRLHACKILHGKPIQQTVTEALEAYFSTQPQR